MRHPHRIQFERSRVHGYPERDPMLFDGVFQRTAAKLLPTDMASDDVSSHNHSARTSADQDADYHRKAIAGFGDERRARDALVLCYLTCHNVFGRHTSVMARMHCSIPTKFRNGGVQGIGVLLRAGSRNISSHAPYSVPFFLLALAIFQARILN